MVGERWPGQGRGPRRTASSEHHRRGQCKSSGKNRAERPSRREARKEDGDRFHAAWDFTRPRKTDPRLRGTFSSVGYRSRTTMTPAIVQTPRKVRPNKTCIRSIGTMATTLYRLQLASPDSLSFLPPAVSSVSLKDRLESSLGGHCDGETRCESHRRQSLRGQ